MAYRLGIDIGTTYTAAAIVENGQASIVALGDRAPVVPTVVFLREDDEILTGDTANRRAATEPGRVARQFKRPGRRHHAAVARRLADVAQALMGKMLRWTLDHVIQMQGGPPDHVTVSHPANWGPYKLDLLGQAIRMAEMGETSTLSEPEAAAIYYSSTQRVEPGETIAVYDLGGGTFDAAVLRKTEDGFEILGTPEGIEHLGGIDIDEAVFAHVAGALGGALDGLDADDPMVQAGVARLRADCVEAKEALSTDSSASIPVLLSNVQAEVRITRDELERMVRPWLTDTISALRRALRSAGVEPEGIKTVLLVGGSSRIPLVSQMVSESLGRPVSVDAHPKHAVATRRGARGRTGGDEPSRGRARAGGRRRPPEPTPVAAPPLRRPRFPSARRCRAPAAAAAASPPPVVVAPPPVPLPQPVNASAGGRGKWFALAGVAAVVVVIGGVVVLTGGGAKKVNTAANSSSSSSASSSGTSSSSVRFPGGDEGPSGRGVRIDSITISNGKYLVAYRTAGYEPKIDRTGGDPTSHHIHFFFDTVPQEDAGTNGPNPGIWIIWDVPSPFDGSKVSDRPAKAKQMCSLVADASHGVELDTGNCVDLPAS